MEKIKVSVIIPVFNTQDYIEKCLRSIIGQNYMNLEVIIIDDTSTDNTVEIVKEFIDRDKRIQLIQLSQNSGSAFARQKGLDVCTGDLLTFVDADDWYCTTVAIDTMVMAAQKSGADCVMYGYRVIHKYGITIKKHFNLKSGIYNVQEAIVKKFTHTSPYWHYLWNKCYKMQVIKENNISFLTELRRAQDVRFNADFIRYAKSYYILSDCYLYDYNCTNINQITRKTYPRTLDSEVIRFKSLKDELRRLLADCAFIGVYDKCKIPLYKQFYTNTVRLLENNINILNKDLQLQILNDNDYKESLKILGNYVTLLNIKINLSTKWIVLKDIIKNLQ